MGLVQPCLNGKTVEREHVRHVPQWLLEFPVVEMMKRLIYIGYCTVITVTVTKAARYNFIETLK
jgi:hypothetical protein